MEVPHSELSSAKNGLNRQVLCPCAIDEQVQSGSVIFNLSSLPTTDFRALYIALPLLKAQMETRGTNVAISFVSIGSKQHGRPN